MPTCRQIGPGPCRVERVKYSARPACAPCGKASTALTTSALVRSASESSGAHDGGDVAGRFARQQFGAGAQHLGLNERHVALQIDHDVVAPGRIDLGERGQDAVRARGQGRIGQHCPAARRAHRLDNLRIARGHGHGTHARPPAAARSTRTIIGSPPMSARGLPGRRVAAMRAGMMTMGFIGLE